MGGWDQTCIRSCFLLSHILSVLIWSSQKKTKHKIYRKQTQHNIPFTITQPSIPYLVRYSYSLGFEKLLTYSDVKVSFYSGAYGSAQHNACCARIAIKQSKFIKLSMRHKYNCPDEMQTVLIATHTQIFKLVFYTAGIFWNIYMVDFIRYGIKHYEPH